MQYTIVTNLKHCVSLDHTCLWNIVTLKAILSKLFHEWNRQITTSGHSSTLYFRHTLTGLIELALRSTGAMRGLCYDSLRHPAFILAIQHCPSSAFLQFFADCLPSGFPSFHTQICTLKVSKDKKHMISLRLVRVSKASSETFDGITLSAQKDQIVSWSLHWQGTGHIIVLLGGW